MEESFSEFNQPQPFRSVDTIISEGYVVKPGQFVSKGVRRFGDEFGIYVAFTLVYIALTMALGSLPFVGDVSGMLVGPPLVAGFAAYMRLQSRNDYREFSSFFAGFRGGNWPSLVSQGISVTLSMALAAGVIVLPLYWNEIQVFVTELEKVQNMDQEKAGEFVLNLINPQIGMAAFLAAIIAVAVMTLFCLAPTFIVYRGYNAFQAIAASWKLVTRKYFHFLLFNMLLWIVLIAGILLCCIGFLATFPIYYLALASAYEDITGD